MSFHHFKSCEGSSKVSKLSEVANMKRINNGDLFELDRLNIFELDKVPGCYTKVTKINLSYNRLSCLDGLAQFRFLTHLHLSNNIINNIKELEKVSNKEQLVVLSIQNNPFSDHPDLLTLSLIIFPRLVELNGVKLNDHTRQDVLDGVELGKKLVNYVGKNEILLENLNKEIKTMKSDFNSLQEGKNSSVNNAQQSTRRINLPILPNFSNYSKIRPYMILDFIGIVGKAAHYFLPDSVDGEISQKCFKWLFCETLLNLNSWGSHNLQLFLQKHAEDEDPEQGFSKQLALFQSMTFKSKAIQSFSDIFPNDSLKSLSRTQMLDSYLDPTGDWSTFPIFSGNSEYLKAILAVLQVQVQLIEELQREKEELLSFDTTVLHVPGFIDKFKEGSRTTSYEFSQDPRASSRTTVKRFNSPINSSYSPQDLKDSGDLTDEKRKTQNLMNEANKEEENLERAKLMGMKQDLEQERLRLEKKMKEVEEEEKRKMQKIEENFKETQKKMEMLRKKTLGLVAKAADKLEKLVFNRKLESFAHLKTELEGEKAKKIYKIQQAEEFHHKKLMKKYFDPVRYFQIVSKSKRIRAENYYKSRILLDTFFVWKNFLRATKLEQKNQEKLKLAAKAQKQKLKQGLKKDFEQLLKQVAHNEKNINKLWKMLKNKKNVTSHDCLCGGFKCQVCVAEKTTYIREELKAIKLKISESKKRSKKS